MVDPSVGNSSIYSFAYTMCMAHIPWDKLAKRGKAARRNILRMFPGIRQGASHAHAQRLGTGPRR